MASFSFTIFVIGVQRPSETAGSELQQDVQLIILISEDDKHIALDGRTTIPEIF